jgi:hypothetical protein
VRLSTGGLGLLPGKALYGERQEVRAWYAIDADGGGCQSLPRPDAWTEHSWDGACAAVGEGVLVVGGYHYFGESGACWRISAGGTSERIGQGCPTVARRGASLSGCPEDFLLFGGRDSGNRFYGNLARWNEAQADCEPVPVRGEGPVSRAYHAACWDQKRSRLWVYGGLSTAEEPGATVLI